MGTNQLGIGVRIEPALTGIKWLLQRHKPAPVQANYWVKCQTLDQSQWKDLPIPKQQRTLNVSESFLRQFREHPWRGPDAEGLSDALKEFLFSTEAAFKYGRVYEAASSSGSEFILAISASRTGIQGLANVPWELTAEPENSQRLIGLNPRVTLCRLIESSSSHVQVSREGPLKLFYVISNQDPRFDREAEAYQEALSEFGERMQPVAEIESPGFGLQPTYGDVVQSINAFSPHILVHIGHGRTSNTGVAQLKFEDWIDVHDLAAKLIPVCNQLFLVILISCDTSWAAALDPHVCGPQAFISHGVPAVVAMQSKISVNFAHNFLDNLLSSLFSGASLPCCVTRARQGDYIGTRQTADKDLEWAAPALFISRVAFDVIQPLAAWKEAYAVQLSSIETGFPAVGETLARPELEVTVSNWLDKLKGVACIEGIFGSGRTTLVSKVCRDWYRIASEQIQPLPRPIMYVNMDEIPSRSLSAIISEVNRRSRQYRLPPVPSEGNKKDEERLALFLDLQSVVLILDDADLLPPEELQSLFEYCKRHLSYGLLILIVGASAPIPIAMEQVETLPIDSLSRDETIQYCTTVIGQNGDLARQWYEESSGNLYLLSLLHLHGNTMRLNLDSLRLPDNLRHAAETFVRSLEPTLSPDLHDLLASIAVFPGGLGKSWLADIFGSDAIRLYSGLLSRDLVTSRQQHGVEWVQVPTLARVGLENIGNKQRQRLLALEKCREFANDSGPDWKLVKRLPHDLELYPGFVDLFRGLQVLGLEIGQVDYAVELTRLLFQALRQLGRMSEAKDLIEVLLESERMDRWAPEDLLRLANTLQTLGDTNYLATILDFLEEYGIDQISDYDKVTYWNLRANCLKDQAATERTGEMLELYEKAEALAQSYLPNKGIRPADWSEQLALTYHNRALTLRYMKRDLLAAQQALKRSAELSQEAGLIVLKAKSDMERAEIELDIPGYVPNWPLVENLLFSARDTFMKYRSRENLAFCLYQIARLHKMKPSADAKEAIEAYDDCHRKAEEAGLVRLAAIALRHRTELEWRQGGIDFDEAISALDSAIETLQYFIGDAWSTRVLRDAQFLAAQILLQKGESEMAVIRLREAWRLAFQAPLHPEQEDSDRSRAARIAVYWIESFGWPEGSELFSGLGLLLGDDWHEQQHALALNNLKHISQDVK